MPPEVSFVSHLYFLWSVTLFLLINVLLCGALSIETSSVGFVRLSCSMELEMGVAFLFAIVSMCSGV